MSGRSRRSVLHQGLAAIAALLSVRRATASTLEKMSLRIGAAAAPVALRELIRQTGLQVLFDFDAVSRHHTREIDGQHDVREALTLMLDGTGLMFEFINERTVAVRPRPSPAAALSVPAP